MPMPAHPLRFDFAPFRLSGVVVGALLNHRPQLVALGDAVHQPPHKAAPVAPVLAIKPRNTLAGDGDAIVVPDGVAALEIGASLGIVIGRTACRVPRASALEFIAGYTIVNDVSIPVPSHYRPSVRFKARDGFCPIGPQAVPAAQIDNPDALAVRVLVDDELVHGTTTGDRIRGVAQLIADVTEFMTLQPGDLLMLGAAAGAPRARAGQRVAIEIHALGTLRNQLVAEGLAA
jgi:5-oxopent-3-ene-1,2,5-tricarboxylate decarboxylase/2-hydroxyhepta-2,4-diene-1,7-dioate isomerase